MIVAGLRMRGWALTRQEVFEDDSPVALWLCRLLLRDGPDGEAMQTLLSGGADDDESEAPEKAEPEESEVIQSRLTELERKPLDRSAPMFQNVGALAERLGLSDVEREILELGVGVRVVSSLTALFESVRSPWRTNIGSVVADALDLPVELVRKTLSAKSVLLQARLIEFSEHRRHSEFGAPEWLAQLLERSQPDCHQLFSELYRDAPSTELTPDDFPHVRDSLDLACSLLGSALANHTRGVNVLVYGVPAAGKTELARVMAKAVGVRLLEVSVEAENGEPLSAFGRFDAYALAQRIHRGSGSVLMLFDEVEEALHTQRIPAMFMFGEGSRKGRDKGWTHRMLEDNPGPAIWIANAVRGLDPAVLRRFTFVIELRTPPPRVRRTIIERYTQGLTVSDAWKAKMSQDVRLAPGHIEAAARAARMVSPNGDNVDAVLSRVLSAGWSAQGLEARPMPAHTDLGAWNPDFVNASCDLEQLANAAAKTRRGTILLYGPPGTGKSAFAKHLAERVSRELVARRASDLLSKWVGKTEKHLAEMFAEARESDAVLLLDEADGFLGNRAGAQRSWELTQVNELLVQMEAFEGLFVCATNLVERLDPAAFRRFALKIRLDPLRSDQRWRLFCATLARFGLDVDERLRPALDRASDLTPGDFVAVVRGAELKGPPDSAAALFDALDEERRMKPGKARDEIGFASRVVRQRNP